MGGIFCTGAEKLSVRKNGYGRLMRPGLAWPGWLAGWPRVGQLGGLGGLGSGRLGGLGSGRLGGLGSGSFGGLGSGRLGGLGSGRLGGLGWRTWRARRDCWRT
eukprot:gene12537-biopygen1516